MNGFLGELRREWSQGTASTKLAITANGLSILGVSVVALFGASALQILTSGQINWASALFLAAVVCLVLAVTIGIHGFIWIFQEQLDGEPYLRTVLMLVTITIWLGVFATGAALIPEFIDTLVLAND